MTTTIFDTQPMNKIQYNDYQAKIDYLIDKHGFNYHPNNPTLLYKNDLIIFERMLYNYDKEQLDCLNWLANKWFVFDPLGVGGYFNEFISYTHDNIQQSSLRELRETYKMARESFYSQVSIN